MIQIFTPDERKQKPPHAKTRGWASIVTSFAYLVPAYILLPSEWPASIAFVILTVGTLLFHATDNDYGLDAAGMLASVFVLVGLPYGAGEEAAFGLTGLLLRDFYNHKLVAILMVPVAAICLIHDAWPWLLGALALFGVGFLVWRRPGDIAHGVWHLCTAAAMTLVVIGL
jgi:hypothetical protein